MSIQTNGTLLKEERIEGVARAGLDRVHVSVHSLQAELSKKLFGSERYSIEKVKGVLAKIKETGMEFALTPVWLPEVNDADVEELVRFGKDVGCKVAIQKYETYRYSRKVKDAGKKSFFRFYRQLREWEKKYGVVLKFRPEDFNVRQSKAIPPTFRIGERVNGVVKAPDWYLGQVIAVARNRCITVLKCDARVGDKVNVRIVDNKNSIYLAERV